MYIQAFLNKQLGDSWRGGCRWAITDIFGVEMCEEHCANLQEQYKKVSQCAEQHFTDLYTFNGCTGILQYCDAVP